MKKLALSLLAAVAVLPASVSPAAIVPQLALSQGTNVVLSWSSSPGDAFMVIHRQAFHPSKPWKVVATNLPAGPFSLTTFTHVGAVPPSLGGSTWSGGGGSPPGPSSATLVDPGTTTSSKDKEKKQDSLTTLPALPDLKELEKLLREMLKEWEKQQKDKGNSGGGVVELSSTYSLPDAAYTNFSGGFYVITRATEDTDLDGMPDWWESQHELNLLANDAQEDPDGDGVPNLAEYAYGTNPRNPASKPVVYVSYTSPVNTNTFLPVVQFTGSINLNVRTLRLDVTNAAGVTTDLEGFVTQRTVVPGLGFTNSPAKYTNAFHCFDVPLTNGANTVALRFTDAYGLTFATTVAFTVDFNASPAAPVGTVLWPANGAQLGTDTFTLRGRLDNPTASVIARLTIDGEEQELGGLVERDGTFWLEDLPAPASGPLTLVFTDAGGKARTNTLNLTRSPVSLVLNDPSGPNLWDTALNLSGSVSDPAYSVWINSVRATVDENGNWTAENVPVNAGGVASFALRAVPNSDNGGAGAGGQAMAGSGGLGGLYSAPGGNPGSAGAVDAKFDFDNPPRIVVSSYTMRAQDDNPTFEYGSTNRQTLDWTRSGAGYSGTATAYYEIKYPPYPGFVWRQNQAINYPFPGTNGYEVNTGLYTWGDPFFYTNLVGEPSVPWKYVNLSRRTTNQVFSENTQTHLVLQTGGRGGLGGASVFMFTASATDINPFESAVSIPPESLRTLGKNFGPDGRLYSALPDNADFDLTVSSPRRAFEVSITPTKHRLVLAARSVPLHSVTSKAEFSVGHSVGLAADFEPPIPALLTAQSAPRWTVSGNFVNEARPHLADAGGFVTVVPQVTNFVRNDALLAAMSPRVWFVNGGTKTVTFSISPSFDNGQTLRAIAAKGVFSIHRPTAVLTNVVSPRVFSVGPGALGLTALRLGDTNGANAMDFAVDVKSRYHGQAGLTQLCRLDYSGAELPGQPQLRFTDWRLDALKEQNPGSFNGEFYDGLAPNTSTNIPIHCVLQDQPENTGVLPLRLKGEYKTYVRFMPDGADSIFVTLGIVTWNMHGEAVSGSPSPVLTLQLCPPPVSLVYSEEFPKWEKRWP